MRSRKTLFVNFGKQLIELAYFLVIYFLEQPNKGVF